MYGRNSFCIFDRDMKNLKEYIEPALRVLEARFEQAFLQSTGENRADFGYDDNNDLGDL